MSSKSKIKMDTPATELPKVLHVRALTDGFRRAGRAWPVAGCLVMAAEFSAEQLTALLCEPQLVVTEAVGE